MAVEVALDRAAAARVPRLRQELRVDDLRRAGWTVTGPGPSSDGGMVVRASHRFRSAQEAVRVVRDVTGRTGPLQRFRFERERSFAGARARTELSGVVDLGKGLEAFGDDDLRFRLGGYAVGLDKAELERQLGEPADRVFAFRMRVRLAGSPERAWAPRLGERLAIEAAGQTWDTRRLASAGACAAALLLLIAVLVVGRRRKVPVTGPS